MEEMEKQNRQKINTKINDKLLESEQQLRQYLLGIRQRQQVRKITFENNLIHHSPLIVQKRQNMRICHENNEISIYVDHYLSLIHEIIAFDNYVGKKILKKIFKLLEEFPSLAYLMQTVYSFGRQKKKLCLCEKKIYQNTHDEMIPLFQKISQKIQIYKKEAESKKLMQLGHRIEHLYFLIKNTKKNTKNNYENIKIFKTTQGDRIQKYITMQDNLNKAQKQYGNFSSNLLKNKEIFANINKVCMQIKNSYQ